MGMNERAITAITKIAQDHFKIQDLEKPPEPYGPTLNIYYGDLRRALEAAYNAGLFHGIESQAEEE
jgi:hypothetical protein